MRLGMVGGGRMGGNMARRILRDSEHDVVVYDRDPDVVAQMVQIGAGGANSLEELVDKLLGDGPRLVWVMVPAGEATQQTVDALAALLKPGDVIVDGGNSKWTDDRDRQEKLREVGIHYVDVGTSGGVWGLDNGYCMMVGGDDEAVAALAPFLTILAPPFDEEHGPGWLHVGPTGAGHYVKMVHNGIEYGMMRAIMEGFGLFDACEFDLDNAAIAHLWMRGSVIRSWLVELAALAFEAEGNDLAALAPVVSDSGEGRWTVEEGLRLRVPLEVITASLFARFASQGRGDFAGRGEAALRQQFGGHAVVRAGV